MAQLLLAAATGAGNSASIAVRRPANLPISFSAPGLATGETGTLQYSADDGATWQDFHKDGDSTAVQLGEFESMVTVYAPGTWRIAKSVTAAAVAVYVHTRVDP